MEGLLCRIGVESDLVAYRLLHAPLVHFWRDIDTGLGTAPTFELESSICLGCIERYCLGMRMTIQEAFAAYEVCFAA